MEEKPRRRGAIYGICAAAALGLGIHYFPRAEKEETVYEQYIPKNELNVDTVLRESVEEEVFNPFHLRRRGTKEQEIYVIGTGNYQYEMPQTSLALEWMINNDKIPDIIVIQGLEADVDLISHNSEQFRQYEKVKPRTAKVIMENGIHVLGSTNRALIDAYEKAQVKYAMREALDYYGPNLSIASLSGNVDGLNKLWDHVQPEIDEYSNQLGATNNLDPQLQLRNLLSIKYNMDTAPAVTQTIRGLEIFEDSVVAVLTHGRESSLFTRDPRLSEYPMYVLTANPYDYDEFLPPMQVLEIQDRMAEFHEKMGEYLGHTVDVR